MFRTAAVRSSAVIACIACVTSASGTTFFGSYQGHDYYVTNAVSDVFDARAQALNLGGHLVTVNDQAEQAWLNDRLGFTTRYWIGLSDEVTEGDFVWDSGEDASFEFWAPFEPNNNLGNEDFTFMNWVASGAWNDVPSTAAAFAIIEVVPGPGAMGILMGLAGVLRRKR